MVQDYLIKNFSLWHSRYEEHAVEYKRFSHFGLLVTMDDGRMGFFEDIDNTFRWLPPDPYNMTEEECTYEFSCRLKFLMRERLMTQTKLSEMTGIPQQYISRYCRGETIPDFHKLNKIARALRCSIDMFTYV